MSQAIVTVTTVVPAYQEEAPNRHLRKLGERDSDLAQHARNGWTLSHTAAIGGTDYTTFVDTLTRDH